MDDDIPGMEATRLEIWGNDVKYLGRHAKNLSRRIGREKMGKTLRRTLIGVTIIASFLGGNILKHGYTTSPEYLRGKKLDGIAANIIPDTTNTPVGYNIKSGEAKVELLGESNVWLQIKLDDKVGFVSEWWGKGNDGLLCNGLVGDARNLAYIIMNTEEGWVRPPEGDLATTPGQGQAIYEGVIIEIDEEKRRLYDLSLKKGNDKLKELAKSGKETE